MPSICLDDGKLQRSDPETIETTPTDWMNRKNSVENWQWHWINHSFAILTFPTLWLLLCTFLPHQLWTAANHLHSIQVWPLYCKNSTSNVSKQPVVTFLFVLQPPEINSTSTRKTTLSPRIHQVKVFLLSKGLLNLLLVLQSLPKVLPYLLITTKI